MLKQIQLYCMQWIFKKFLKLFKPQAIVLDENLLNPPGTGYIYNSDMSL